MHIFYQASIRALFLITLFSVPQVNVNAQNKIVVVPLFEQAPSLANVLTVSKKGGDYQSINNALTAVVDATESNPYVIYVGPGEYRIATEIVLKEHVSIVGSGQNNTVLFSRITDASSAMFSCDTQKSVVVSNLSMKIDASTSYPAAQGFSLNCASVNIEQVDLSVSSSSPSLAVGIRSDAGLLAVNDSTVHVTSTSGSKTLGLIVSTGSLEINNTKIITQGSSVGSHGLLIDIGADFNMHHSSVSSSGQGVGVFIDNDGDMLEHAIRNSLVSSLFSTVEIVKVSYSTVKQVTGTGQGRRCVFSDDGVGEALLSDCSKAPLSM